jgi:ArsR family transcriptional regulator
MGLVGTATTTDLARVARWFHALADETRLRVVEQLRDGEQCVCDLTDVLETGQSRLSFHLKTLKEAGLLTDRREGRWVYYALNPEAITLLEDALGAMRPRRTGIRLVPRRCD